MSGGWDMRTDLLHVCAFCRSHAASLMLHLRVAMWWCRCTASAHGNGIQNVLCKAKRTSLTVCTLLAFIPAECHLALLCCRLPEACMQCAE